MNINRLREELMRDEGVRLKPYRCTSGKLTIGIGRNLDDKGISEEEAQHLLGKDIADAVQDLHDALPGWRGFSDTRQRALTNMMFNLGRNRFKGFRKMIAAIQDKDWDEAAWQALDSKWAKQVGERAERIAEMLRQG